MAERRQTAARLLRIHDFLVREADAARREEQAPSAARPDAGGRLGNWKLTWAERERHEVLVCLAVCLAPAEPRPEPNAKDLLDRARWFVKVRT